MTLALAVLLLVTPPQVSQDSTEALREHVQELEARISTLEERQDIRRGYYLDTLWGERTAYAALLTLIGGLFVLINFAVVQWRIRKSEEEAEEKIETKGNIIKNETEEYVDSEISDLDSEINHVNEFATDQIVEIRVGLKRLNREYKKEAAEIYEILEEKEAVPEGDIENLDIVKISTKWLCLVGEYRQTLEEKDQVIDTIGDVSTIPGLPSLKYGFSFSEEMKGIKNIIGRIGPNTEIDTNKKSDIKNNFDRLYEIPNDDSLKEKVNEARESFEEAVS